MHKATSKLTHRSLPYHGMHLLGKLYKKLSGKDQIPKALVHRAIANGLEKKEVEIAFQQAKSREEISRLLMSVANDRLNNALYWTELGLKSRSRDNYFQASLWSFYAYLLTTNREERLEARQQCQKSYEAATPFFAYSTQLVQIPFLNANIDAYLRLPYSEYASSTSMDISSGFPCVILFNGFASSKEELHFTENSLLTAGIATLSFDYPLVDHSGAETLFSIDINELNNSLYLFLCHQHQINPERLGLYGISIGGNIVLALASQFSKRFKSVVTLSAPSDLLSDLELLVPVLHEEFALPNTTSPSSLYDIVKQTAELMNLSQIDAPLLVAGGGKDIISSRQDSSFIYNQASSFDKKLLLCPKANHGLYEMMPSLRYEIAQWIKQRI